MASLSQSPFHVPWMAPCTYILPLIHQKDLGQDGEVNVPCQPHNCAKGDTRKLPEPSSQEEGTEALA